VTLEDRLRAVGAQRYHDKHPFQIRLQEGRLNKAQVQAWALNRYYYQSRIPMKDAALIARMDDPELRRAWRQRLLDQDGTGPGDGGIARWLRLTDALGLDRKTVRSCKQVLPATRFAVDAYVRFVAERSLLEAVASSLTELFAPSIIARRVEGMLAHYDFVDRGALAYFDKRLSEAPRDADFALDWVKRMADTPEKQQAAVDALSFKCDVLWAQLDALDYAYGDRG
jgi:pyrroloquinoline-quinone synthase